MNPTGDILVVDSDHATRRSLVATLEREGYRTREAQSAHSAREMLHAAEPGLLLIGWTLPGGTGLWLTEAVRHETGVQHLPIILLAQAPDEDRTIKALESGADDCIAGPFSDRELLARIRVVMRRRRPQPTERLEAAELTLDHPSHRLTVSGQPVNLAPAEFRMLAHLMAQPETVLSRRALLAGLSPNATTTGARAVDVHIRRIRRALEPSRCDRYIQTVRGYGYRFSTKYLD